MTRIASSLLACVLLASPAHAQHAGDIFLAVEGNTIVTKIESQPGEQTPQRVFASELGEVFPNFTDEPGFACAPATFPIGSRVGFRIMDSLRRWNGADFSTVPAESLEVAFSTLAVLTPATPQQVEGFTLPVNASGEWHRHLEFTLGAPAASGVYLLQLQLLSTADLNPSQPFWIVFNQNEPEAIHDAAIEWVEFNLANPPPCGTADFNGDSDFGTDQDIEAFFACLAGACCPTCFAGGADFNADGDFGTDQDIEAFFRVLAGGAC